MHAQSQPRPRPANPERAYGVRKTGARAFALLATAFALLALTLTAPEARAQAPTATLVVTKKSDDSTVNINSDWTLGEVFVFTYTFSEAVTGITDQSYIDSGGTFPSGLNLIVTNVRATTGNTVYAADLTIAGDPASLVLANVGLRRTDVMDADGNNPTNVGFPGFAGRIIEPELHLYLDPPSITEGNMSTLTAVVKDAPGSNLTVTLTAPSGSDTDISLANTITIASGATTGTTAVTATSDSNDETEESFEITGSASIGGSARTAAATLFVSDAVVDPNAPTVTITATGGTRNLPSPITITVAFSEDVTGFNLEQLSDFTIVASDVKDGEDNDASTGFTGNVITVVTPDRVWRQSFTFLSDRTGTATVTVPANAAMNSAGVGNAEGTLEVTFDSTRVATSDDPERREDRLGEMVGAVGRTLGWDIAHTIRERARADRSGADTPLRLSGVSENTTLDELISRGASLDMALNADAADNGSKGGARVWARVGHSQFDSEPLEDYQQDGELTSLHAGMDFRSSPDRLFGAAVGWHDAQVDYEDRGANVEGDLELEILTINPYASKTRDRWHTWGTVGFGVGEMTYTEQNDGGNEDTSESDVTLWNAAGGLEYTLGFIGAAELSARGEGMAVSMQTDESDNEALEFGKIRADAYGVRGEVEVGLPMERADGGAMRPFAVLGMRWEDGDGDADGLSAELGGGITARNADFFVDASVRAHTGVEDEVADVLAWGLALGFDRANDHRGLAVELNHRAGPQPWDPFADNGLAAASDTTNTEATPATLGATTRYGLDYRNGRMTPYNTLRFDGNLLTEVETGIQYRLLDLSLGLKHVYDPSANADEHILKLIGRITF